MLDSLQCRCISAVRVHIFLLGHHLSQLWRIRAREKFAAGPPRPPPQPSTGQPSNYNPRWRHQKPGLLSVPLQNNACTVGYILEDKKKKKNESPQIPRESGFNLPSLTFRCFWCSCACPSASQILRYMRHLYLELLHLKPEVNIALQRVTFHCHKRSELATAAGIEKCLT